MIPWQNQNSETMLIHKMLESNSFTFVLGYMTALASIENPPNNGIDYKWCVNFMNREFEMLIH